MVEEQIVQINFKDHTEIQVEDLLELRKISLDWTNNRPYCTYVESGAFNTYKRELRDEMSKPENSEGRIAVAVFNSNLAVKLIVDFFWKITGSDNPTRLFSTREEALDWLRKERDAHNQDSTNNSKIA